MSELMQSFPEDGLLAKNLNRTCSQLAKRIGKADGPAYSYVVRTVGIDRTSLGFEQYGSAPNFQGGVLTLCTCKHQMRSSLDCSQWHGKWIAGFTSRCRYHGRHWLFYLMRVAETYESHADLWENIPARVRQAKSAQENFLGDLFAPRGDVAGDGRFKPSNYQPPSYHDHHKHKCDNGWHNDIKYKHTGRFGRPPSLLVGDPKMTFLWDHPAIYFDGDHCRNFKKWPRLSELYRRLKSESL